MQYRESLDITFNPNYRRISCSWWWIQDELGV